MTTAPDGRRPREAFSAYLVDDSPIIRVNLTTTLEELCGIKVMASSESEAEAIAWLTHPQRDWRLAIVDIFLRPGSGIGVLAATRHRKPNQKTVALTNYATPAIRKTCLEYGANAVFDKSREIDALIDYCKTLVMAR